MRGPPPGSSQGGPQRLTSPPAVNSHPTLSLLSHKRVRGDQHSRGGNNAFLFFQRNETEPKGDDRVWAPVGGCGAPSEESWESWEGDLRIWGAGGGWIVAMLAIAKTGLLSLRPGTVGAKSRMPITQVEHSRRSLLRVAFWDAAESGVIACISNLPLRLVYRPQLQLECFWCRDMAGGYFGVYFTLVGQQLAQVGRVHMTWTGSNLDGGCQAGDTPEF